MKESIPNLDLFLLILRTRLLIISGTFLFFKTKRIKTQSIG